MARLALSLSIFLAGCAQIELVNHTQGGVVRHNESATNGELAQFEFLALHIKDGAVDLDKLCHAGEIWQTVDVRPNALRSLVFSDASDVSYTCQKTR